MFDRSKALVRDPRFKYPAGSLIRDPKTFAYWRLCTGKWAPENPQAVALTDRPAEMRASLERARSNGLDLFDWATIGGLIGMMGKNFSELMWDDENSSWDCRVTIPLEGTISCVEDNTGDAVLSALMLLMRIEDDFEEDSEEG